MIEHTAETKFGSWTSRVANLRIEYPLDVLDDLRLLACAGFDRTPRGIEIGGVLFGAHHGRSVRIAAWRPLPCEHAHGNALVLSEKDLRDLASLLRDAKNHPELKELDVLGWVVSHTNGKLELTADDVQIFNLCFPAPWQFAIVLCPERLNPTRAAFFVRTADGSLCEHSVSHEIALAPIQKSRSDATAAESAGAATHARTLAPIKTAGLARRSSNILKLSEAVESAPAAARAYAAPRLLREPPRRKRWLRALWAVPVMALLVFAALLSRDRFVTENAPPSLSLRLQDSPSGQLQIDWDKAAAPIRDAQRGWITIDDAGRQKTLDLNSEQLRLGELSYSRRSGDVKVTLAILNQNAGGAAMKESAQLVGPPPAEIPASPATPAGVPEKEKSDLEVENRRLRAQLAEEREKTRQLRDLVRILETRQAIVPDK